MNDTQILQESLPKRAWCYVQPPAAFEVAPCACGNHETQWSEYEKHVWCDKCQKDFIPEHGGIFSGPIPVNAAAMLGVSFDRYIIATQTVQRFNPATGKYDET